MDLSFFPAPAEGMGLERSSDGRPRPASVPSIRFIIVGCSRPSPRVAECERMENPAGETHCCQEGVPKEFFGREVSTGITFQPLNISFRRVAFVTLLLVTSQAVAQIRPPDAPAAELVRQTVSNELAANDTADQYMCRAHEETPQGSETRVMVETRDWAISRLILKNNQPLSSRQKLREDESLHDLLTNRVRLVKLQTEKHADDARARKVIRALPEAFLYEQTGMETNSAGRELALLTCRPNPDFRPHSAELRVLQKVEGTMLVDPLAMRFVRVKATLTQDVDFGWGIFDRISRGGSFLLEQQVVWHNQWELTTLALHYTNRRLLLMTSRVDSVTKASDFRRLPDDLTLPQAFALLLNEDSMTAVMPESGKTP